MSFSQKIKSAFVDDNGNRKHLLPQHRIPNAPAQPEVVAAPLTAEPLTSENLALQREQLAPVVEAAPQIAPVPLAQQTSVQPDLYAAGNRASVGLVRQEPTLLTVVEKDVVVHERIHPIEKEEVQPIIYREREQLDVKQITQLLHETQIQPTIVEQRELPAERREAIVERGAPIAENYIAPRTEIDATLHTQVIHAPIVNEVIKKTIIEEIQPVLERDIITSTVIQNTQPIYEKVVEAPQVFREVRMTNERRLSGGSLEALAAQGFNISALDNLNQTREASLNGGEYVSRANRKSLAEALPNSYGYLAQNQNAAAPMPATAL